MTTFEDNDDDCLAIFCSAGEHSTVGLDLPYFFDPTAEANRRRWTLPMAANGRIRSRHCKSPDAGFVRSAVHGGAVAVRSPSDSGPFRCRRCCVLAS